MIPHQHLTRQPVYACCFGYGRPDRLHQIRLVFHGVPGYVQTALVALTLADAERLRSQLNTRLGLDRDAWINLAAQAMRNCVRAPTSVH